MAQDCSLQMPEDFVLPLLPAEELKDKYRRYLFRDYVEVCMCWVRVLVVFAQRTSVLHTAASELWPSQQLAPQAKYMHADEDISV